VQIQGLGISTTAYVRRVGEKNVYNLDTYPPKRSPYSALQRGRFIAPRWTPKATFQHLENGVLAMRNPRVNVMISRPDLAEIERIAREEGASPPTIIRRFVRPALTAERPTTDSTR
jgi:hypothetical protein